MELPTFTFRIIRESEHFVFIAPPSRKTTVGQALHEMEFILSHGLRPILKVDGPVDYADLSGWICERLPKNEVG